MRNKAVFLLLNLILCQPVFSNENHRPSSCELATSKEETVRLQNLADAFYNEFELPFQKRGKGYKDRLKSVEIENGVLVVGYLVNLESFPKELYSFEGLGSVPVRYYAAKTLDISKVLEGMEARALAESAYDRGAMLEDSASTPSVVLAADELEYSGVAKKFQMAMQTYRKLYGLKLEFVENGTNSFLALRVFNKKALRGLPHPRDFTNRFERDTGITVRVQYFIGKKLIQSSNEEF